MYAEAHRRSGGRSTLLEWDADIPALEVVHAEALKAKKLVEESEVADALSA